MEGTKKNRHSESEPRGMLQVTPAGAVMWTLQRQGLLHMGHTLRGLQRALLPRLQRKLGSLQACRWQMGALLAPLLWLLQRPGVLQVCHTLEGLLLAPILRPPW